MTPRPAIALRPDRAGQRAPHPTAVGLCRYCRRQMWTETNSFPGYLSVSCWPETCDSCRTWMRRNPGQDPTRARGNVAERIPAELPEHDPSWRDGGPRCEGLPGEVFDPDPDPDDEPVDVDRAEVWADRRHVAERICLYCPVRAECRIAAAEQGYEGVWGGVFFDRRRWIDLITGETGWTIHVTDAERREHDARLTGPRQGAA